MEYPWYMLSAFFFLYAFLGWCLEVACRALRTGRFCNEGLLAGPVCPAYGVGSVVILVALEPLSGNIPAQLAGCVILANVVEFFSGAFIGRVSGRPMQEFHRRRLSLLSRTGLLYTCAWGGLAILGLYFLHPFVYLALQFVPALLLKVLVLISWGLLACDTVSMLFLLRRIRRGNRVAQDVALHLQNAAMRVGHRVYRALQRRLFRAFPELAAEKPAAGEGFGQVKQGRVFAQGVCLHKLLWVFVICALLGDWIETVYVYAVSGVLMSRSSLIYGTFSVVWGFGAALLTVMLAGLADRPDRVIFLAGALLGGFYEYMCSVFTELVFGTVFWDYSDMPLNIGGRTNVLFMIFWGILSVVWIKILYPRLSALIEKIPPVAGVILTWVMVVLMCADMLLSGAAMLRYTARRAGTAGSSAYGAFLDRQYPDSLVEWTWPNMQYTEGENAGVTLGEQAKG